jgi:hypothetical protein
MEKHERKNKNLKDYSSLIIFLMIIAGAFGWIWYQKFSQKKALAELNAKTIQSLNNQAQDDKEVAQLSEEVVPQEGVELPVTWKDLGKQLIDKGVIDSAKFEAVYAKQGGLSEDGKRLLYTQDNKKIIINSSNAPVILNLLWALGLGNKNPILEKGPMVDPQYGGAGGFASTGGWTLSSGDAMAHYSKHSFITLTSDQQAVVERVSKGIYRPCCNNPTYFPDCNHGMAMLGFLELMASQGVSENDMYKYALAVNSYWFENTYLTLAKYFQSNGTSWDKVDPKTVLSKDYSSASGYKQIQTKVDPVQSGKGSGCGV